nr:hypothetical protein [uncultured Methanobacterium sp.]
MIESPTTLILGAGASAPYGYPLGKNLKNRIIRLLSGMMEKETGWVYDLNIPKESVKDFVIKLDSSERPSIDSFLEKYKNYTNFSKIGKIAIVDIISQYEGYGNLRNPNNDDNWYGYLVENLYESDIDELPEKISIISYNYDRSLEEYLILPLLGTYPELETFEDCESVIKKIPIVHMYGRLDPLLWEENNGREYGKSVTTDELFKMSKNLKLIHEAKNTIVKYDVNNLIDNANKIYFLGMDLYRNRRNLDLLDLSLLNNKTVCATMFDLKVGEICSITSFFNKVKAQEKIKFDFNYGSSKHKSLDTMRNKIPL